MIHVCVAMCCCVCHPRLDVYSKWEKWSGNKVAPLQVGEVFRPQAMSMRESRTQPPQALTESDLISEMDRNGIGTDGA